MTETVFQFDVEFKSTEIPPIISTCRPTEKKEIKQFFDSDMLSSSERIVL